MIPFGQARVSLFVTVLLGVLSAGCRPAAQTVSVAASAH